MTLLQKYFHETEKRKFQLMYQMHVRNIININTVLLCINVGMCECLNYCKKMKNVQLWYTFNY